MAEMLDGIEMPAPIAGAPGYVETAMRRQLDAMERAGNLDDRHAGAAALAMLAARNADSMGTVGRPSGRAMMLTAVTKVLELLPEVEEASDDTFAKLLEQLQDNDDEAPARPGSDLPGTPA